MIAKNYIYCFSIFGIKIERVIMEINNNTQIRRQTSFGMAMIKPNKAIMQELEAYLSPRSFRAFVEEQSRNGHFDIETVKNTLGNLEFRVVSKGGETYGYGTNKSFVISDYPDTFVDARCAAATERLNKFFEKYPKIAKSKFKSALFKVGECIRISTEVLCDAFRPAKQVHPALRAAGDEANRLSKHVEEAKIINQIIE